MLWILHCQLTQTSVSYIIPIIIHTENLNEQNQILIQCQRFRLFFPFFVDFSSRVTSLKTQIKCHFHSGCFIKIE